METVSCSHRNWDRAGWAKEIRYNPHQRPSREECIPLTLRASLQASVIITPVFQMRRLRLTEIQSWAEITQQVRRRGQIPTPTHEIAEVSLLITTDTLSAFPQTCPGTHACGALLRLVPWPRMPPDTLILCKYIEFKYFT